jgi:transglutaminase-like putative cysteine protease
MSEGIRSKLVARIGSQGGDRGGQNAYQLRIRDYDQRCAAHPPHLPAWLTFSYQHARATRTGLEAHEERIGVCRDFAHLLITFCRCLNIPARYVNGYIGEIGVPPYPAPMDFSSWVEVFLDNRWYAFDARHNEPRIGRIVVARGRDATDVPLVHSFGSHTLKNFKVWTDEVKAVPDLAFSA